MGNLNNIIRTPFQNSFGSYWKLNLGIKTRAIIALKTVGLQLADLALMMLAPSGTKLNTIRENIVTKEMIKSFRSPSDLVVGLIQNGYYNKADEILATMPHFEQIAFHHRQTNKFIVAPGSFARINLGLGDFGYNAFIMRTTLNKYWIIERPTSTKNNQEIYIDTTLNMGRNHPIGKGYSVSREHAQIVFGNNELHISDNSSTSTSISSTVPMQNYTVDKVLEKELFSIGDNFLAHGTPTMGKLLSIAFTQMIGSSINKYASIGKLIKTDILGGRNDAGSYGPFYVVLSKSFNRGLDTISGKYHTAYLVPNNEAKENFLLVMKEANELGVLTNEEYNTIAQKLMTYEEFIAKNSTRSI